MILEHRTLRAFSSFFQKTPAFKGKTRLIRILNKVFLPNESPIVVCRFKDGSLFKVDLRTRMEAIPAYLGSYETDKIEFIRKAIQPGWTALDVGANIGFFAVPMAQSVGASGKLFCFEPLPKNFARLNENLKMNQITPSTVETHAVALSDEEAVLNLGLFEDFAHGGETGNAAPLSKGHSKPVKEIQVQATRFDDFSKKLALKRLDFIKIDIEGHEDAFFRGAQMTVDQFRPIVLGEFSEEHMKHKGLDVDDFMKSYFLSRRYRAFKVSGRTVLQIDSLKGRSNTDDVLLVPEEKVSAFENSINKVSVR